MATVSHRLTPTQAHAIADLTGYEDADTLRWQQACLQTAQQLTAERGRYAGADAAPLAQGLDLAQRGGVTLAEDLDDLRAEVTSGTAHYTVDLAQLGCPCLDVQQRNAPCMHLLAAEIHTGALGLYTASEPLIPPDTAPPATHTSVQEEPGATASGPARVRRTRAGRAHRGQAPAPTGSAASWPTSEAPASMNVKLKVGNMELMYTARDTNFEDTWQAHLPSADRWDVNEAPASCCLRLRVGEIELMYTMRDVSDAELTSRVQHLVPWVQDVLDQARERQTHLDTFRQQREAAQTASHTPASAASQATAVSADLEARIQQAVQQALATQQATSTGTPPANGHGPADARPPGQGTRADTPSGYCALHGVTMEQRSNAKGAWSSHWLAAEARWCRGK